MSLTPDPTQVELAYSCTRKEAEAITSRFREALSRFESSWAVLATIAIDAYTHRVWIPLGYISWDAYCSAEIDTSAARIPREIRVEIVGQMSAAGMSTRAIAPVTNMTHQTVVRDQRRIVAQATARLSPTPAPGSGSGSGSESSSSVTFVPPDFDTDDEANEANEANAELAAITREILPPQILSKDGRKYPRKAPKAAEPPRRLDMPTQAKDLAEDVRKLANKIQKLRQDDRFGRNKEQVSAILSTNLLNAIEVYQDLLNALTTQ